MKVSYGVSFIYPTTCGLKGYGSSSAAAEATPVLLLKVYPFPVPDGVSVIVGLPYLLFPMENQPCMHPEIPLYPSTPEDTPRWAKRQGLDIPSAYCSCVWGWGQGGTGAERVDGGVLNTLEPQNSQAKGKKKNIRNIQPLHQSIPHNIS